MAELKQRRLPTFGTAAERRDRLRKFHGRFDFRSGTSHGQIARNAESEDKKFSRFPIDVEFTITRSHSVQGCLRLGTAIRAM